MDRLPDSLLLQILSRLDDSADIARCRVASKAFDSVFPHIRSVNLQYTSKWCTNSTSRVSNSQCITKPPLKKVFLGLVSKLKIVESICIRHQRSSIFEDDDIEKDDLYLTDVDFAKEWLPRVSESLKSLSLEDFYAHRRPTDIFPLISAHCDNLHNLEIRWAWLSVDILKPMAMLTTLTLTFTRLEDEQLNEFNNWFPNLQVLELIGVRGLKDPKIHLLNLKTCIWGGYFRLRSLTLIAPMLSFLHLNLDVVNHPGAYTIKKFENLTTLWLKFSSVGFLLSEFPITKSVEHLTLGSKRQSPLDVRDLKVTLRQAFTVFPNVSSLCIYSGVWSELEGCSNPEGWDILDGRKGLKTICLYLKLVDPSSTFSSISHVLDQCDGLLEVSLLIHDNVVDTVSKSFMSKCTSRWPGLEWRWGVWDGNDQTDYWRTDSPSY